MFAEILTRLEEMNAQLHSLVEPSTSSCHPPTSTPIVNIGIKDRVQEVTILVATSSSRVATPSSAPPAPSSTPTSLKEATLAVNIATSEHPPAPHTNCSTLGRNTGEQGLPIGKHIFVCANPTTSMVQLSRSAARMSTMLIGMMEGGCVEGGIHIEGADADADILSPVAAYCEKHRPYYDHVASAARFCDPFLPFPIDFTPATYVVKPVTQLDPDSHGLEAWDHKFISNLPDNLTTINLVTVALASPTSSPISAPSLDTDLSFQTGVTELLATAPTRCSTLAPCQAACIPVSIGMDLQELEALFGRVLSYIHRALPEPPASADGHLCNTVMDSCDMDFISSSLTPYNGLVPCCLGASRCAHKVLEVRSVFMGWTPLTCCTTWGLYSADELRPVWWSRSYQSSGGELPKHPRPALECNRCVGLMVPQPWPPPTPHNIMSDGINPQLKPWPPNPFLTLGDQFNLCGNQLVVESGGLQPKPPWWLLVCVLRHQEQDLFTWLLLRRAGTVIHFVFRKGGSKYMSFLSSRPHKMLKWFAVSQGDLMINGLCLHQLVEDGNTLVLLIFLPDGIEKHIKPVTVESDVQGMFVHQPLKFSFSEIINLDDLVMSASPSRHAAPIVYFLGSFMVLSMQVKLEPWPLSSTPDHLVWFTILCHDGLRDVQDHNHIWTPFCYNLVLVKMWQRRCRRGIFAIETEFMDPNNLTSIWKALGKMSDMHQDMILVHEKQWKNEKMILCLQPWALYGHKQVTDQKVELRPWPWLSFSCYPAKARANALSYFEVSADFKYHKCECWLHIHSTCVLTRVAGCWHFLLVLLSLRWSAQLLDLVAMRKVYFGLHVQEEKALYVLTCRLLNVLDWCQIHSMNLNQVCFSEIQQVVGIHWKEIRSELRGNGMTVHVMFPGSLVWGSRSMENEKNIQNIAKHTFHFLQHEADASCGICIRKQKLLEDSSGTILFSDGSKSEECLGNMEVMMTNGNNNTDEAKALHDLFLAWITTDHGLPLTKDGVYRVSFYIKEHIPWDPGGLLQQRLGDKPCFKEGRMSGTYCILVGLLCGLLAIEMDMGQYHRNKQEGTKYKVERTPSGRASNDQTTKTAGCGSRLATARVPISFLFFPSIHVSRTF